MAPGTEDRSAARRAISDYLHTKAPEARRPAVDAVIWMSADRVEGAARILLDDGDDDLDLVAGSGPAAVEIRTDAETLVRVASDAAELPAASAAGRWQADGSREATQAFESSFAGSLTPTD